MCRSHCMFNAACHFCALLLALIFFTYGATQPPPGHASNGGGDPYAFYNGNDFEAHWHRYNSAARLHGPPPPPQNFNHSQFSAPGSYAQQQLAQPWIGHAQPYSHPPLPAAQQGQFQPQPQGPVPVAFAPCPAQYFNEAPVTQQFAPPRNYGQGYQAAGAYPDRAAHDQGPPRGPVNAARDSVPYGIRAYNGSDEVRVPNDRQLGVVPHPGQDEHQTVRTRHVERERHRTASRGEGSPVNQQRDQRDNRARPSNRGNHHVSASERARDSPRLGTSRRDNLREAARVARLPRERAGNGNSEQRAVISVEDGNVSGNVPSRRNGPRPSSSQE